MDVSRHRQYLILQQVSLLVLPTSMRGTSKRRPANHPLRYTPHRRPCAGGCSTRGMYPRALKCMGCPPQLGRQTVRNPLSASLPSLSCPRFCPGPSTDLVVSPNSRGRQFAILCRPACVSLSRPRFPPPPVPKQTSLSYQYRRQKQTAQSPAPAKVDCPVTSVSGISSSPRFQALTAATI